MYFLQDLQAIPWLRANAQHFLVKATPTPALHAWTSVTSRVKFPFFNFCCKILLLPSSLERTVLNIQNHLDFLSIHIAPSCFNTVFTVLNKIRISSPNDQLLMYSVSSLTTSSKSVISLRPDTCHIPVNPGFVARRAR